MAIISGQVLGKLKQSAGGITFTKWKNKQVAKAKAESVANPNSVGQQKYRKVLRVMSKSSAQFGDILRIGMKPNATAMTEYNAWVKANYSEFKEHGDNITVNVKLINKVALEKGIATPEPTFSSPGAGSIQIECAATPANTYPFATKAGFAIASPETDFIEVVAKATNINADAAVDVTVNGLAAGDYVVYFFLYGNNGQFTSVSVSEEVTVA
jgi:hypothetical protein